MKKEELYVDKIESGDVTLGIEFGSTRIKAVLIDSSYNVIANGYYERCDKYENDYWTYDLDEIHKGMVGAYKSLKNNVLESYNVTLKRISSIGISGMMHGFLAFDENGELLTPFRTWRNTYTDEARKKLTNLFSYNIPHRWSIAHLYQSILNKEPFVKKISYMTTLSGYIHLLLTGEKVLGIGDCSGMFPIDDETRLFDKKMIDKFNSLNEVRELGVDLNKILPKVMLAGEPAGFLTKNGAKLLDPEGDLVEGCLFAPPEGDAGTGMTATNTVGQRTGNISVGTSIFSMIVLEKPLSTYYDEIDIVTTPDGKPVAMVHCNNGTSDFDRWLNLFKEFYKDSKNQEIETAEFYNYIYNKAMDGDLDAGGLITFNYLSGEPITNVINGRPMVIRNESSRFTLSNFLLSHLYSIIATVRIGQNILTEKEDVIIDEMLAHGGVFNTKEVMQNVTSAGLGLPVAVYESAGEGGAWGISILASYVKNKKENESLDLFLQERVFKNGHDKEVVQASEQLIEGFNTFLKEYENNLDVVRLAGQK